MRKVQTDNIMTIEELAVYLKLSKSTLYKLSQEGKVPGQKVGRHWRYHRDVIDQRLGTALGQNKKAEKTKGVTAPPVRLDRPPLPLP